MQRFGSGQTRKFIAFYCLIYHILRVISNGHKMVNILEIENEEVKERLVDFDEKGGVIRLALYEIKENYLGELPSNEYLAHLIVARQTVEKFNYEANFHWNKIANQNSRNEFPLLKTDFDLLDSSGEKIDLEHFLGPYFDYRTHKPFMRGQLSNDTLNAYFYFDSREILANKVDMNSKVEIFRERYPNNKGSFIYAFMEPPYNIQLGKDIKLRGEYLLEFMNFFFGDLNKIEIFAWSTDCSAIFEAGKEWWGNYFWTVYNPIKNWYVGMLASETD